MQWRHLLYQGDGVVDVMVWLGKYQADRAKYPMRLVQFYHHGRLYRYLTNVLALSPMCPPCYCSPCSPLDKLTILVYYLI